MTDIAHGDIKVGLNQEEAMAGLAAIEGRFDATMAHISHAKAHAEIGVATDKFDAAMDRAKARLDEVGRSEARAELKAKTDNIDMAVARVKARLKELDLAKSESQVKANKDQFDREIASANLALDRLNARKARVTVEVKEGTRALDQADRLAKFAEKRNSILRDTQKVVDSMAQAEAKQAYNDAQRSVAVLNLKKHYADLTDQAEKLDKKSAYGREATVKLKLASDKVDAEMLAIKEKLTLMGEIPPVHVKVDTDGSFLEKAKIGLIDFLNKARSGLDGLGSTRVNLGPISASLKGLVLGGSALAPILTSLGGSIVALAGSITTSLAGAASVGGGLLIGLASNFLGVAMAVKPAIQGFELARTATKHYTETVEKHGAGSKQAIKAQEEMNHVLKSVPADSRNAAVGLSVLGQKWHDLTGQTAARDFGKVITGVTRTMGALLPGLAANTNATMNILSSHIGSILGHLRQPAEIHAFDRLGADANKFLGPALSGVERFGAGLLHIGESAAHIFAGPAGNAIKRWGQEFEQATQPGAKLDGTMKRLGNDAKDLISFFGAFGKLAMTVLNGASGAGDHLTNSMTGALNRYNAFLSTEKGKKDMAQFFSRSVDDVKALAGAFGPLIAAFVQWSNLLAPFTSGILKGIGFVSRLVAGFTKLVGLGGPMAALGATVGAAFAVSKIGGFVNMLYRAVQLTRELGAVGTIGKILSGGFGNLLKTTNFVPSGVAMGEAAAGTMEGAAAGIGATIGEAAAAAMDTGGILPALAKGGGQVFGPAGAVAGAGGAAEGGFAALGADAAGTSAAVDGLAGGLSAVTVGLASAGGLALVLGLHFLKSKEHMTEFKETLKALGPQLNGNQQNAEKLAYATRGMDEANAETAASFHQSNLGLKQLKQTLDSTKKGTDAHREAELAYNNAVRENVKLGQQWNRQKRETKEVSDKNVEGLKENLKLLKETEDRQKTNIHNAKELGNKDAQKADEKALLELQNKRSYTAGELSEALDRQASVNARLARSYAGLPALTNASTEALGRLARTAGVAGQQVAKAVATKYTSSVDVSNVSSQARKALSGGVSGTAVLHIVADSSNAKQALESLRNASNVVKHLDVIERGGAAAVALLSHIAGIHLTKKDVAILQHGGENAISLVEKLIGTVNSLHGKNVNIAAIVHGQGELTVLNGEIARVHSTSATITVKTVKEESTVHLGPGGVPHGVTRHGFSGGVHEPWEKTKGGVYSKPTLLVGEENRSEYVIATNPAYRSDNVNYLREAARMFGYDITEAAKGKATQGQPKAVKLQEPAAYEAAAVQTGPIQSIVQALNKAVKSEHTKLNSLHLSAHKAREVLDSAHQVENRAKPGPAKKTAHEHTVKAQHALDGYHQGINALEHGGTYQGVHYQRSLGKLEDEARKAQAELTKLENANAKITHYNSVIQTDQSKLSNLATIYNGHGPNAGSPAIKAQWDAVMADRKTNIKNAGDWIASSKSTIARLISIHPTKELEALLDTREGEEAQNNSAQTEAEESVLSGGGSTPSAEQYAETYAANQLPALLNAFAIAQTNNVPDLPGTPQNEEIEHLSDDLSAAKGLQSFWEGLLTTAQIQSAPIQTITDIANAVTSARGTEQGLAKQIEEGTASAATQAYQESNAYSVARLELYKNYGSNFDPIRAQPITPANLGVGAQPVNSTTTHVNVTNNFSHPPADPHTWSNGLAWELGSAV